MYREKARGELNKNATFCFEQILEAANPQNCSCTATYIPSQKPSKSKKEKKRHAEHCWRSKDELL